MLLSESPVSFCRYSTLDLYLVLFYIVYVNPASTRTCKPLKMHCHDGVADINKVYNYIKRPARLLRAELGLVIWSRT
jgi:hypothetical protein